MEVIEEKDLSKFRGFVNSLEGEALSLGANKISIFGSTIRNDGFVNPFIAKRFGYSLQTSNTGVLLQKVLK